MKKSIRFFLASLCLYFSVFTYATAQNNFINPQKEQTETAGVIKGIIADSITGKPMEYASVALLQKGSAKALAGTLTDAKGTFSFTSISHGDYELVFSFIGYKTKFVRDVSLTESRATIALEGIKMSPLAAILKEVQVQTLRPTIIQEADRMVVSIEGTALAAGKSAFEILATAPGIFIDHDGNIQLNGKPGVTIMVDGRLTYLSARDLRTMLEGMSAENIKNLEIITNPSARYDAEGSAGMLNINLKKNTQQGLNGSAYAGYIYNGKQHTFTSGGSINYKRGSWNSYLVTDMARRAFGRESSVYREFEKEGERTSMTQTGTENYKVQGPPSFRFGSDYSLNKKHSLGFMANYTSSINKSENLTNSYLSTVTEQPYLHIQALNNRTSRSSNLTGNLHYLGKLDTLGTTLSGDVHYVKINNRRQDYAYSTHDALNNEPVTYDAIYMDMPIDISIYAAQADYSMSIFSGQKLDLGIKASSVVTDNHSLYYANNEDLPVLDPEQSYHFAYKEGVYAGYINWSGKISKRIKAQAGLRAEQTTSVGELLTTRQVTERDYLDLFPSMFVQQNVTDNYEINYSYSRRLFRPVYSQLNPFISIRDPYTFHQGNPYLRPQYSHSFSITQSYKNSYRLVVSYNNLKGIFSELPSVDKEKGTTTYMTRNVDDSHHFSVSAIAPVRILKNWDTNNTMVVGYKKYKAVVEEKPLVNENFFYTLQSNHNILLPKSLKMEINASYRGPSVGGFYKIAPVWWVNLGVNKSFADGKLNLSLNANDIFKSNNVKMTTEAGGNVNETESYFRSRTVGLTLRYRFSKGEKFDAKRRNSSLDELNRTGS